MSRIQRIENPSAYLKALRDPGKDLRRKFRDDPLALAERLGLQFPEKPVTVMQRLGIYDPAKHGPITPGIRELVEDLCLGRVENALGVAARGAGKSRGASFIEFFLVFIKDYDALNLGGSELQADQVYQYLLEYLDSDPYWRQLLDGEPIQSKTETIYKAWIRVLASSQKSARSPHAGGIKPGGRVAGGVLVIDEEAEAEESVVKAALPTVNTARPSVTLRISTNQNATGSFSELIDHHQEMGYKEFRWTVFDVAEACDCQIECQSPEPCFREDHWEDFVDPSTGQQTRRLVHAAYCGTKSMFASGWVPQAEIVKLWKSYRRNHALWEVEAMGSRPTSAGYVIKDQMWFLQSIVPQKAASLYLPGFPVVVGVDWGTLSSALTVWQEQSEGKHVLLHADLLQEASQTQMFGTILSYAAQYQNDLEEIAADSGGGGNYLNPKLREDEGLPVRDVVFSEEKESAVAVWNMLNESGALVIPDEHIEFISEVKGWRRINGRIAKGSDHLVDSSICYFARFINRMRVPKIRIMPRSFSSGPIAKPRSEPDTPGRIPMARGFGRGR